MVYIGASACIFIFLFSLLILKQKRIQEFLFLPCKLKNFVLLWCEKDFQIKGCRT